jgi:hypothetical protein
VAQNRPGHFSLPDPEAGRMSIRILSPGMLPDALTGLRFELKHEFSALIDLRTHIDFAAQHFNLCFYHIQAHAFAFSVRMKFFIKPEYLVAMHGQVYAQSVIAETDMQRVVVMPCGDPDNGIDRCIPVSDAVGDKVDKDAVQITAHCEK